MSQPLNHLILVAERSELAPFIHRLSPIIPKRYFEGYIGESRVGVYITGVGKNAVKRSADAINKAGIHADTVWNVGNVGALSPFPRGLILRVGRVIGQNGHETKTIDPTSPFSLVTVNTLQDKASLSSHYPFVDIVDMEAFHWLNVFPKCRIVKVVLDSNTDTLQAPVKGWGWSWRIRQNAKRLSRLMLTLVDL